MQSYRFSGLDSKCCDQILMQSTTLREIKPSLVTTGSLPKRSYDGKIGIPSKNYRKDFVQVQKC